MTRRVMVMAGGTGGHVFPALAVARYLKDAGHQVTWMGTLRGLEARLVPEAGFVIDWLSVAGFRGKHGFGLIKAPFLLLWACVQAASILRRRKPDLVIGMGGFVAGPGGFMAWLMRIPLVIHEQNTIPGTTNRLLARLASQVLEAFPGTFKHSVGAIWTGNPVRAEIVEVFAAADEEIAAEKACILILGGSQGARRLNQSLPRVFGALRRKVEIFHQTGARMQEETRAAYQALAVEARVVAFVEDMSAAYRWADLVICRAGAMTVSELAISGLPSILVPFPFAIDDHQTRNAQFLVEAGAALLVPESEDLERDLSAALNGLLDDVSRIRRMAKAASALARPEATRVVAEYCLGGVA